VKRNKPIFKQRKPGKHWRTRCKNPNYLGDWGRQAETWRLYVPQSATGAGPRNFDMTGARPYGTDGDDVNPEVRPGLYRWRLDRGGKTVLVYTAWQAVSPADHLASSDKTAWYVFTAKGKCRRARCPLTQYGYADNGSEIPYHRPGGCPLGIPLDAGWKYRNRMTH
jgi:hypothetical protein